MNFFAKTVMKELDKKYDLMIIEEYYNKIKREFKAECLVETELHKIGKTYSVITYVKPDACIYVENEDQSQHLTFHTFFDFIEKFKIL